MKKFKCNKCNVLLGEMTKGKIKKDTVMYCGKCNYQLLLNKNDKDNNPVVDFLNKVKTGKVL